MKAIKSIALMSLLTLAVSYGCKKEVIPDHKTVTGTVTYVNSAGSTVAPYGALVNISGSIVATNSSGQYTTTLATGSYTFSAEYTDANGFRYKSGNYSVTIGNDGNALTVNISMK